MELLCLTVGPLQENCYFLVDQQREALIIDPGSQADEIERLIVEQEIQPIAILLTHAHCDHIGAIDYLRERYAIPVYIHRAEAEFLSNPTLNLSHFTGDIVTAKPADAFYPDELGSWSIGSFAMELAHIPGHSPGSVAFIFAKNGFVIGGDVLFKGSIGRTDFPNGSQTDLVAGITRYLLPLDDQTVVFPGHGEPTTIGEEKETNPFLK